MKAVLCLHDPEEESILSQIFRFANIATVVKHDLPCLLHSWSENAADLLLIATEVSETLATVVAVRSVVDVPLVVIVDPVGEEKTIELYKRGADLIVVRPYSHRLLKAQAEVLLRRSLSVPLGTIPTLQFEQIRVDPSTRTVHHADSTAVTLTHREFQLFYILFTHRGQILTTERIVEAIWGYNGQGDKNMLRTLVNRVRHKIEEDPNHPRYLVTVSGVGYRFDS